MAQVSDSLKAEMRQASDKMYHIGSRMYVEVDAISDGFLQPGEQFALKCRNGRLWLNDKELPERYESKLKAFYAENYRNPNTDFAVHSTAPEIEAIFHPDTLIMAAGSVENLIGISTGRDEQLSGKQSQKIFRRLIAMIAADSLVDTASYYSLQFSSGNFVINGKKIDDATTAKYTKALKRDGFDAGYPGASIWYNNNYRKQRL